MNIQDAIRSGRPFRRKSANVDYWLFCGKGNFIHRSDTKEEWQLNIESMLAYDWELQPEVIEFEEVTWEEYSDRFVPYVNGLNSTKFNKLEGKRTRVRIEVLP